MYQYSEYVFDMKQIKLNRNIWVSYKSYRMALVPRYILNYSIIYQESNKPHVTINHSIDLIG